MSTLTDPATLAAPAALRVRKPSWRDPRLAIGVVLVLGSIAVGGRVVALADDTRPFFVVSHPLTPGDPVGSADVRIERAAVGSAGLYLEADRPLPAGLVARQSLGAGQLVPLSALGTDAAVSERAFGVEVTTRLASTVRKGARVDLWVTEPQPLAGSNRSQPSTPGNAEATDSTNTTANADGSEAATLLVAGAEVAEVQEPQGAFSGAGGPTVQVLLGEESIRKVLSAQARKATLSVLPAAGG